MEHLSGCMIGRGGVTPENMLRELPDDELEAFAIAVKSHLDAGGAWLLRAVEELDRRSIPERRHMLTTRQWLKRFCQMTGSAASSVVSSARALAHLPTVAKRAEVGEIPAENVRRIAAAYRSHPDDFELHEPVFADIATYLDARDLRRAVGHWEQQVDRGSAVRECADRRSRRRMSLQQTIDGMWHHEGWYDPESGHIIATALHALADAGNLADTASVPTIGAGSDTPEHEPAERVDRRTHAQRMVDALVDVCRFSLDHADDVPTSGGSKPHITVTVNLDQLASTTDGTRAMPRAESPVPPGFGSPIGNRSLPELDGTPILPEAARMIACDAGVVPIVLGAEGEVLDIGRQRRTVTSAIRRALEHRDGGCRWEGCDRPTAWCDAHHLHHWALGGATSVDNMVLLCRHHHTAIHELADAADVGYRVGGWDPPGRIGDPPVRPPP